MKLMLKKTTKHPSRYKNILMCDDAGWQRPAHINLLSDILGSIRFPQMESSQRCQVKKGRFYSSGCLRGNHISPNRNLIEAQDDEWRAGVNALLLLPLEMGEN